MKDEISAASDFLTRIVGKNESLSPEKVNQFRERLEQHLLNRFKNHWFPDKPSRGQAFRCIRVNENIRRDPTLEAVCLEVGIKYIDLMLPIELTLWIDPEEVTCRFGEHKGAYCVVAAFKDGNKENYVDQINVDELEKQSVEQARQASFDIVNAKKKRMARLQASKQAALQANGSYNPYDFVPLTTSSSYYSSSKYSTSFSPSNVGQSHMFSNSYSVSPPSRASSTFSRGFGQSTPVSTASPGSSSAVVGSGKGFSRGLHSAFNSASSSLGYNNYQNQDRFHWTNKSIVKA